MAEYPIDFCTHLALAVFKRQKTATYKPLSTRELALHTAGKPVPSPYGHAGDVLWMREAFGTVDSKLAYVANYAMDGYRGRVALPSRFVPSDEDMVREQARLALSVATVDIVSLQGLDEVGAKATGTLPSNGRSTFLDEFKAQWDEAYPRMAWAANPLCWRVTFAVQ